MAEYFDILTSTINKKDYEDEDINKHFNGFMVMKWLSYDARTCYDINIINSARGNKYIPKLTEYKIIKQIVKLPKNTRLPFDKVDKEYNIILDCIAREFKVSSKNAEEYINILGGQKTLQILNKRAGVNKTSDPNQIELRKAIHKKEKEILKIKGK